MNEHTAELVPGPEEFWDYCPVEDVVAVIGGKWKPSILLRLRSAARRFNEIQRLMRGCSARMLALHLRELESDGLIQRVVDGSSPQRVEYSLTELGHALTPVLDAMAQWGLRHGRRRHVAAALSV